MRAAGFAHTIVVGKGAIRTACHTNGIDQVVWRLAACAIAVADAHQTVSTARKAGCSGRIGASRTGGDTSLIVQ